MTDEAAPNRPSSVSELFESIGRDPSSLIGTPETTWLDFKKSPYQLANEHDCWELAKDVSAFANSGRTGVILIGVETVSGIETADEIAVAIRPIADGVVKPLRMEDIIHTWVYPQLDVEIRSHKVPGGLLWTVLVEIQRDRDIPFVVVGESTGETKSDGEEKINRSAFGVYRRSGSRNVPYPPSQVQQWLHAGWSAAASEPNDASLTTNLNGQADTILQDDILSLGVDADLHAFYFLQAGPKELTTVSKFYEGSTNPLISKISALEPIRESGFNFPSGLRAERTNWDGIRIADALQTSLSVSRTGIVTAVLAQDLLTWATEKYTDNATDQIWINPVAIAEFSLEFWRFVFEEVGPRFEDAEPLYWRLGLRNTGPPVRVLLPKYRPTLWRQHRDLSEPSSGTDVETEWKAILAESPGPMAYYSLAEIYPRFGYDEALIPFSDGKIVRADRIISETRHL